MEPKAIEELTGLLRRQPHETLVSLLMDLARTQDTVAQRLHRLGLQTQPAKLAAEFRKDLNRRKRSRKFHGYREAPVLAQSLEEWLQSVEDELIALDPAAAMALFEAFIESDSHWFDHADDSGGAIGDVIRQGCRHWLKAASRCEAPSSTFSDRLVDLYLRDEYGAREELLRSAHLLLNDTELLRLVDQFETRLAEALSNRGPEETKSYQHFKISGALSLLSESLRDPDIKARATLRLSPSPNSLQRATLAKSYLQADRPGDALKWLDGHWGHLEGDRQKLLAQAYEALGRTAESSSIRRATFDTCCSADTLEAWLKNLPPHEQPQALRHAHEVARGHANPVVSAMLLLHLDDDDGAERRLVAQHQQIEQEFFASLIPLAARFREKSRPLGETVVVRALLLDILKRAKASAYHHAADYWHRLTELRDKCPNLEPLVTHEEFMATVRLQHGRKVSFWAHVDRHPQD